MKTGITPAPSLVVVVLLWCTGVLRADGFIVVPQDRVPDRPSLQSAFPLEVRYHRVKVALDEQTARTEIDQEFYNPTDRRLEGFYLFPLPPGAVIDTFSLYINGQKTSAELLDADRARAIYEEIVRRMVDPALLEYYGQGLFRARVFPIEPRSTRRVTISYRESLVRNSGIITYTYPLNTEKFSARPLADVSVIIELTTRDALKNIYSPSHPLHIVRTDGKRATVSWEARNSKPDKDLVLHFSTGTTPFGLMLLADRVGTEDGYFLADIAPALHNATREPKDVTFVIDVSGSMAGAKLDQARRALRVCITNLRPQDRFELIPFSTEARPLFNRLQTADKNARGKALDEIDNLQALGGTAIGEALEAALRTGNDKTRRHMVVFMTDGKPTIGATDEDSLVRLVERCAGATRIFTLGIGNDLNTHLLDRITELTHAFRTYVGDTEDLEVKISDLFNKLQAPVLTDVRLRVDNGISLQRCYPATLPDLFAGSSINLVGRWKGPATTATITLSGMLQGTRTEFAFAADFTPDKRPHRLLPALWATRRIAYLLDQIRLHGEEQELREEVTALARQHGIITPYTSYLIVEDEAAQVSRRKIRPDEQIFEPMMPPAASGALKSSARTGYSALREKSGQASVEASRSVQSLAHSRSLDEALSADRGQDGLSRQIGAHVRIVQGRAMYRSGSTWVDPQLRHDIPGRTTRLIWGSAEYFTFLAQHPDCASFFSLGRSVRFVFNGALIEVVE